MRMKHKVSDLVLLIDDYNISKSVLGSIISRDAPYYRIEWYNRNGIIDSYTYREDDVDEFKGFLQQYLNEIGDQ